MSSLLFIGLGLVLLPLLLAALFSQYESSEQQDRRNNDLIIKVDSLLPQTQCGDCGYAGCLLYASAVVSGEADINQCPPGDDKTVQLIAELLARSPEPLPKQGASQGGMVAVIDEGECIGCVKCIKACPVDAIVGASKKMHTVMPKPCTGCRLCIAPCPVDCISMEPTETSIKKWIWAKPSVSYEAQA